MTYTLDDLANQLEHFELFTLLNIVLVNLGARNAMLIESHFAYLPNSQEYEIAHTKYPVAFKRFYNFQNKISETSTDEEWESYARKSKSFYSKYRKEIDRIFLKRVKSSLSMFYPDLHCAVTRHGIIVSKAPIEKSAVDNLQNLNDALIGKILEYPCRNNFMKPGHPKSYNIQANLRIPGVGKGSYQIFGNTFCDEKDKKTFESLAKKYEKVLKSKKSIFHSVIENVFVM